MTELVILLGKTKLDIVNALKMKSSLLGKGILVSGVVVTDDNLLPEFIEDLMQLQVKGSIN